MTYLERLKKLNMHQGTTDKTDKSTSVSFVSPPQAQMDEHAEAVARQTRVIEWLNANPAPSAPDRCAGCGGADAPGSTLVPFGTTAPAWLHSDCWRAWYNKRLAEAGAACLLHS